MLLGVYSLFTQTQHKISVNVGDTYYVISNAHFYVIYAILLAVLWLIYLMLDKMNIKLVAILSDIHIYGMLILFFKLIFVSYANSIMIQSNDFNVIDPIDYNLYIIAALLAIILLQFLFIINIFVSITKKLRASLAQQR